MQEHMVGSEARCKGRSAVLALAAFVVIGVSLSGCGGSEETTVTTTTITMTSTTTTTTPDCTQIGGFRCTDCNITNCFECQGGYALENGTGQCVADCIVNPMPLSGLESPDHPSTHNGKAWPLMCVTDNQPNYRFLGIGDWGGVKGSGEVDNVFGTGQDAFVWNHSWKVTRRGYREPADKWAQNLVARNMKKVHSQTSVDFVINAGDNFYPGGIEFACGSGAKDKALSDASGQFTRLFHNVYGPVAQVPWLSVLGNHDFGGMSYDNAWDAQIFRTWSDNGASWRMPAMFWSQRIQYRDFAAVFFMMDSNRLDARPLNADGTAPDQSHNICQNTCTEWPDGKCCTDCVTRRTENCWSISRASCFQFFQDAWTQSVEMLEQGVKNAPADWHFIVTHFPGPSIVGDPAIRKIHEEHGIDLVFTGHTHLQLLETNDTSGIPHVISGGGGGISSDAVPSVNGHDEAYGFVEFIIDRTALTINMHTWGGPDPGELIIFKTKTVAPAPRGVSLEEHKMEIYRRMQANEPDDYDRYMENTRDEQNLIWGHANIAGDVGPTERYV